MNFDQFLLLLWIIENLRNKEKINYNMNYE
jgi:hypothetical protein